MKWTPFILGIVEDGYSQNVWIFVFVAVVGFLLCYYRYKLAWIVFPIIILVSAIFIFGLIASGNYQHILYLAPQMLPKILGLIIFSPVITAIGTFLGWKKFKAKQVVLP